MKIISTLESHLAKLQALKNNDFILRKTAFDSLALVLNRIQQRGQKADGTKIGGGKYSAGYKKKREKAGKQTSYIDLTFTNQMLSNLKVIPIKNGFAVGFDNERNAVIADYLEQRFGDIFSNTEREAEILLNDIQAQIKKILQ